MPRSAHQHPSYATTTTTTTTTATIFPTPLASQLSSSHVIDCLFAEQRFTYVVAMLWAGLHDSGEAVIH